MNPTLFFVGIKTTSVTYIASGIIYSLRVFGINKIFFQNIFYDNRVDEDAN